MICFCGQILDNDGIVCLNEFQIFKAAMNWIAHSPTVRAAHVPRLLDTIRFSNMSEGTNAFIGRDGRAAVCLCCPALYACIVRPTKVIAWPIMAKANRVDCSISIAEV